MTRTLAHMSATLGSAAYGGVMIAIGLGLGAYWLSVEPMAFQAWFTANFVFLLPTVGITLPFALSGTAISLGLAWRTPQRTLWAIALGAIIVTLVITLGYHLPANFRVWSGSLPADALRTELVWWLVLYVGRVSGALVSAVVAFIATQRAALSP